MLQFLTHDKEGKLLLGLGLEAGNMTKLMSGQPIIVRGEPLGLEHDIFIFYGTDTAQMIADLKAAGITLPPENWRGYN